jgi:hypothetical protein
VHLYEVIQAPSPLSFAPLPCVLERVICAPDPSLSECSRKITLYPALLLNGGSR